MTPAHEPHSVGGGVGRHLLGPHVVGTRVVVRRILPGESGPTGGPAMTDVLGTCLAWDDAPGGVAVVATEDGERVTIPTADIVSGKPVPPRPSTRHRVGPAEAQRHGFTLFPDLVTEPVGAWVLRDSPTATARRAHSVLAFGPSGVDDDLARVVAHYERPIAAVLAGSPEEARLRGLGWVPESHEAPTVFQVAGVARVARALRGQQHPDAVLTEPDPVAAPGTWARVRIGDAATGYAATTRDWVGFGGIAVDPGRRRSGLGLAVMAALVEWGAELGATTAFLQVLADNTPALALYERIGFEPHHTYCYLTPPASGHPPP